MNGTAHRIFAAAAQIAVAGAQHEHPWQIAAGIPFAVAFSAGPTSPDLDDTRAWKKLDRWIPDEWFGDGGPMQHRGLLHWWGIPAAVAYLVQVHLAGSPAAFAGWAIVVGWASHLIGDLVFGRSGRGTQQGVPMILWSGHIGLGFKSDGRVQHAVVVPACCILVWWSVGAPGTGDLWAWLDRLTSVT